MFFGFGYDVHRLDEGETIILGGVGIESSFGTVAHSDGDVLMHAIIDAILGAAGLGDIGEHFPDADPAFKNADSSNLLEIVIDMIRDKHLAVVNIDATIVLEIPKLAEYKTKMRENISEICKVSAARVNIKATTNEKLGYIGRSEGLAVYAVCSLDTI